MKTAEEWVNHWYLSSNKSTPELIKEIQSDAIRHCADYVGSMPYRYKRMAAWDGRFREACTTAFFDLMGMSEDRDPNTTISADEYAEYYNSVMKENE